MMTQSHNAQNSDALRGDRGDLHGRHAVHDHQHHFGEDGRHNDRRTQEQRLGREQRARWNRTRHPERGRADERMFLNHERNERQR